MNDTNDDDIRDGGDDGDDEDVEDDDDVASDAAETPSPFDCGVINAQALPAPMIVRLIDNLGLDEHRTALAPAMLRGCLLSLSLSLLEKDRVTRELHRLSDSQISELTTVFGNEIAEFTAVARREFHVIADLQARSLWSAMALMGNRCGTSPRLERAWLKRTLRRCPAQGPFRRRLAAMDGAWWREHTYARWAYRSLFAPGHAAWSN